MRPLPLTGGCLCGALRYEVRAAPLFLAACHCTDCQKRTGSAFSMNMQVREPDFAFVAGAPVRSMQPTPSGSETAHLYCAQCYVRIASLPKARPGLVSLRPGTLDDTAWLKPTIHIYTRSAMPGAVPVGAPQHETMPTDFTDFVKTFRAEWDKT